MQKLVLNPNYSQFFESNGNSTSYPAGFFEKVLEINIRIVFFSFSKESFILCLARLLQDASKSCGRQLKRIADGNREHQRSFRTKVAFAK
ncbi:MAG: hypothetical protein Q8K66_00615 [Sediminibacterium sp.]|nr:hypothetical protein [Sediminibacterium sp.]